MHERNATKRNYFAKTLHFGLQSFYKENLGTVLMIHETNRLLLLSKVISFLFFVNTVR